MPSPSAPSAGSSQPADRLGDVRERVRAGVAVARRVGQRADAAGVDDDDERARGATASALTDRPRALRGCALKYTSFSRSAERCV